MTGKSTQLAIAQSGRYRIVRDAADIQWVIERLGKGEKGDAGWTPMAFVYNEAFVAYVLTEPSRKVPLADVIALLQGWLDYMGEPV